ncbi:MAG TPA: hypothetical protein VNC84_01320 [Gammaproteobacteria bacterium]|jgi:hypothetical protein|nr:hypothetical protein [Gammaproteobacteria bacterium]
MSYLTREDGTRFVIPSYREILIYKQESQLKKEILSRCEDYGEYIVLHKKGPLQYEAAFSADAGYLLGESIWFHFKKPLDMVYCEALPDSNEVLLVIVRAGSVYLDGSFSRDAVADELLIFLTEKNHFDIFIHGDVPISQTPEEGKFSFNESSIKSFSVLTAPAFPKLAVLKQNQLRLVDVVLKSHSIGVFPVKKVAAISAILLVGWMLYVYVTSEKAPEYVAPVQVNPYQAYYDTLKAPLPEEEIKRFVEQVSVLLGMPGWVIKQVSYGDRKLSAQVISHGGSMQMLMDWAQQTGFKVLLKPEGIMITRDMVIENRPFNDAIYPLDETMARFMDKLALIYPGNHIRISSFKQKENYTDILFGIELGSDTPLMFGLLADQLSELPFVLKNITVKMDESTGHLSGTINIEAVGK